MISIAEGFDLVGKTTFLKSKFVDYKIYKPDYRVFDHYFNRNLAFMYGYGQMDLFKYLKKSSQELPDIVYDRSVYSSYVYSWIYPSENTVPFDIVVDFTKSAVDIFGELYLYYVHHMNDESMKLIFDHDSSDHNEPLDQFNSFDEYKLYYLRASDLFESLFDQLIDFNIDGFHLIDVSSYSNPKYHDLKFYETEFSGDDLDA